MVIAPRLSWWPAGFEVAPEHRADWLNQQTAAFRWAMLLPILFAGVAAYFIAFWPGKHPVRRIVSCIYVPTLPIVAILGWRRFHLIRPYHSVLEAANSRSDWPNLAILRVPGLQFCLTGLLLITIFVARLNAGRSSLPLALPPGSLLRHDHPEIWRRTQILVWVLVGPLFLTGIIFMPLILSRHFSDYLRGPSFSTIGSAVQMLLVLAVVSYIVGSSAPPMLRRALRLPGEKGFLLGASFAIGIPVLISAGEYLWERAQFLRHDVGTATWEPGTYLHLPEPWLLLLFFPALIEEIIFRGFLHPRLTQRYGLYRGIFLVGIVWAAFHFPWDFRSSHFGGLEVFQTLFYRLFMGITLSFVLGWLTLDTGSVLAAGLAHTFYNLLIYSDLGPTFAGKNWLRLALWAALAWALFRYWPVKRGLQSPETVQFGETVAPSPSAPIQPSAEPENP